MAALIVLSNPRTAQAYIDYMALMHVECRLNKIVMGYEIELVDASQYHIAKQELDLFLKNPDAAKYHNASWQRADTEQNQLFYASSKNMLISNFLKHSGVVTTTIFLIAAVIYVLSLFGMANDFYQLLIFPNPFSLSEPWRLFTPALLHFSPLHILFNLLWWWYLGGMIERKQGKMALIFIFIFTAVLSNFSQFLVSDNNNFGGLSGVVYGLMGYIWWSRLFKPQRGLLLPSPYVNFMLVWLVIGYFQPFGMSIANTAHLSGLIVGCLLALLPTTSPQLR